MRFFDTTSSSHTDQGDLTMNTAYTSDLAKATKHLCILDGKTGELASLMNAAQAKVEQLQIGVRDGKASVSDLTEANNEARALSRLHEKHLGDITAAQQDVVRLSDLDGMALAGQRSAELLAARADALADRERLYQTVLSGLKDGLSGLVNIERALNAQAAELRDTLPRAQRSVPFEIETQRTNPYTAAGEFMRMHPAAEGGLRDWFNELGPVLREMERDADQG